MISTAQMGSSRLQPGVGTLLSSTAHGFIISSPRSGMSFNHPWTPLLVGADSGVGLRLSRGIVDGFEPKIDGEPMSGLDGQLPPILKLNAGEINAKTGESWAVLEVTPNDKGVLDKDSKIVIVHRAAPGGNIGGAVGAHPLALVIWKNKKPVMVWPVAFFNVRYVRRTPTSGQVQHFFL